MGAEGATPKVGDVAKRKKHGKSAHPPPGKQTSRSPHVPVREPSRLPKQVAADATEEVYKLEAAVQELGGENNVHAKLLVESLKAARAGPSSASEREVDILPEFPRTSPEASDEGR